jgi:hypothetical protein
MEVLANTFDLEDDLFTMDILTTVVAAGEREGMRFAFWSSLRFSTMASFVILAVWLTPASASVIYNGGAPDQGGQIYSQPPDLAAMTFELTPGETEITGVSWWGGCYPATTCGSSPTFEITIWSDNSGTPGTVLDTADVGASNQTATGNLIGGSSGWDEYSYSVSIPAVVLSADTTYFLGIQETGAEPSPGTWGWETTSSAPAGASLEWYTEGSWGPLPETLAFELNGGPAPVPEPTSASLALFGIGLVAFVAIRRRRRA